MISSISSLASVGSTLVGGASSLGASALGGSSAMRSTTQVADPSASSQVPDFGSVMADVSQRFMDTMKAGEVAAIQGVQGKASVQEVVQAVMNAEQSLNTAIAIRDKVVAAYQEFSHMAI